MAYILRTTKYSAMLVEMTDALARRAADTPLPNGGGYRRVSAKEAHQWVRDGGNHETALYIDGKRIRRAGE